MNCSPPRGFFKAALLGAAFFLVRGAGAGEQLSTALLVKESDAVVVIDNTLDRKGQVKSWLRGDASLAPTLAELGGVCVPDRAILKGWLERHPAHAGRATWKAVLAAGHAEQVVFLAERDGTLRPTCETEVMLGRSFAVHPDYAAFRTELDRLLAAVVVPPAPPAPTTPAPTTPAPTTPAPTTPAPLTPAPPATTPAPASPSTSSGCL
jgi:hypothetical protein